jgi:uncharacterized BrkB/YihY/UPF0761 family membrane protein
MAEVWNVPAVDRPGFGARLGRTMATLGTVGAFLLVSTALVGALTTGSPTVPVEAIGAVVSILLNIGLFAMAFRLLTPTTVAWRPLMPGAVVGGFGWTALQYVGGALVEHTLKNSSQVYGFFAIVLGLLAWIYLGAQLTLYAAESNVVRTRRLWPRSLQPPLTDADRRVLTDISMEAKRSKDQGLSMRFESGGGAESRPGSSEVRYHPEGEAGSRSDAESVGNR